MGEKKKLAVLVRERQEEALRMAVGLTVLGDVVDVYFLDTFLNDNEKNAQSLEAINAMGGAVFTNVMELPFPFIVFSDAAKNLSDYDAIIPY
jgi:hypothetical protein